MDFIKLFNEVVKLAKPVTAENSFAKSMVDEFKDLELDSLDYVMLYMYFGDIYGISEEQMRDCNPHALADFKEFLESKCSKKPESVDQAIREVK